MQFMEKLSGRLYMVKVENSGFEYPEGTGDGL